jgi:hypothetical protein
MALSSFSPRIHYLQAITKNVASTWTVNCSIKFYENKCHQFFFAYNNKTLNQSTLTKVNQQNLLKVIFHTGSTTGMVPTMLQAATCGVSPSLCKCNSTSTLFDWQLTS